MPHHAKKKVIYPRFLTHKAEAHRRKTKKSKSAGGAKQKNRSAAAQAARKIILLFHHFIRPLARLGFCARRFCHTGLRAGIQFFWMPD